MLVIIGQQPAAGIGRRVAAPDRSRRWSAELMRDAALDGFSPSWTRVLVWYPLVGLLLLVALYLVSRTAYYWLLLEDHPVEWIQFAFLVTACPIALLAAVRQARGRRAGLAVLLLAAALLMVGLAGEEISWGQRVFDLTTPAALESNNKQGEITLHNLYVDGFSFDDLADVVALSLAGGGICVAVLTRRSKARWRASPLWWVAPPLVAVPGFALTAAYRLLMLTSDTYVAPILMLKQAAEFCLYPGLLLTVACCYARAAPGRFPDRPSASDAVQAPSAGLPVRRRDLRRGTRSSLPATTGPLHLRDPRVPVGRSAFVAAAAAALALTAVFAHLTAAARELPGNVPPSLESLYREMPW